MKNKNEMMSKKYRISVILNNSRQLIYTVDDYEIIQNSMIRFFDTIKGKYKTFDARTVEIEEEVI